MTSIADLYRNIVLTVIAVALVFIAFGSSGTTVQAQAPARLTRITVKDGVLGNIPNGDVRAMACPSPNECYIVTQ